MSSKKLRRIAVGPEATAGTAVAATERLIGPGAGIQAMDTIVFIDNDDGDLIGEDRTAKTRQMAQLALPERALTFEQFPWLLHSGVEAIASGVADGTGSGYVYTFDFGRTAAKTLKTLTVEAGNDQQAHEMEYGFTREFTVAGENTEEGQVVTMAATLQGRQRSDCTFTDIAAATGIDYAVANKASLYLDAVGGSMGGTQVSSTLIGWSVRVNTGWIPVFSSDGALYFTTLAYVGAEILVDVTLRYIGNAETEENNWLAQTARLLELKLEGAALATADTYTYKSVRFQLPGKWENFAALEDRNGDDIITGTFRSRYNSTFGSAPTIVVVNEEATYWV